MLGTCNTCVRLQSRVISSGATVNSEMFFCLFVFWFFIYLVIFGLLIPWFANVSVMWLLVSLVIRLFLQLLLVRGRGAYFLPFVFFFFFLLLSFPRRKGYFILHMSGVMDSSCPDQSLTYVSIIEAYISFEGGCKGWV